jgi:hypothetical protein
VDRHIARSNSLCRSVRRASPFRTSCSPPSA